MSSAWQRSGPDKRLRGRAGQAQRARRLAAEPLCRACKARGLIVASTVPDHIVPLARGGIDDDRNIQCLCAECHDAKTRADLGHRDRPAIGADGWPVET